MTPKLTTIKIAFKEIHRAELRSTNLRVDLMSMHYNAFCQKCRDRFKELDLRRKSGQICLSDITILKNSDIRVSDTTILKNSRIRVTDPTILENSEAPKVSLMTAEIISGTLETSR